MRKHEDMWEIRKYMSKDVADPWYLPCWQNVLNSWQDVFVHLERVVKDVDWVLAGR